VIFETPNSNESYCIYFDLSKKNGDFGPYILFTVKSAYVSGNRGRARDKVNLGTLLDKEMGIHQRRNYKKKRRKK